MHMQYDWTVMLLILPMGIVLGYARSRSGSIWVPIVLHMLNNMVSGERAPGWAGSGTSKVRGGGRLLPTRRTDFATVHFQDSC